MWASWMDIAFAKLDANGDGFISLEELLSRLPNATLNANAADEGERLNAVRDSPRPVDVMPCSNVKSSKAQRLMMHGKGQASSVP